jgi:predicted dehydrogenase
LTAEGQRPLRVGVVGVGHLGSHHARIYHASDGWQLAGVFDSDPAKNSATAEKYRLPLCITLNDMLERVDALSIVTPTDSHFHIASEAIGRGKHVLVEKPVCGRFDEAQELGLRVARSGVIAAVGHIERFNPAVQSLRERIGQPRFIEAHRLNQFSPRGLATDVLLELMIHDIDLARWLTGAEPVDVHAAGVPVLSSTDDIANARLVFPGGCIANLTASRISANPMRKIRIFSQDHYTSVDLSAKSVESYRLFAAGSPMNGDYRTLAQLGDRAIARWSAPADVYDALEAELEDFRMAIIENRAPRVPIEEGVKSLKVALDVGRACRGQGSVATQL